MLLSEGVGLSVTCAVAARVTGSLSGDCVWPRLLTSSSSDLLSEEGCGVHSVSSDHCRVRRSLAVRRARGGDTSPVQPPASSSSLPWWLHSQSVSWKLCSLLTLSPLPFLRQESQRESVCVCGGAAPLRDKRVAKSFPGSGVPAFVVEKSWAVPGEYSSLPPARVRRGSSFHILTWEPEGVSTYKAP